MFKFKEKQGFILWKGQTIYMINWIKSILNARQWWPDSWLGAVRPWAMTRSTADRCQCYVIFNEQDSKTIYWVKQFASLLAHWSRVTHICVSKLTSIGSDSGLSPDRRQAIVWNNVGILLIWPLGINFSGLLFEIQYIFIQENAFENGSWKIAAILSRAQCVNLVSGGLIHSLMPSGDGSWCDPELTSVGVVSCSMNKSIKRFIE